MGLLGSALQTNRESEQRIQAANLATTIIAQYQEALNSGRASSLPADSFPEIGGVNVGPPSSQGSAAIPVTVQGTKADSLTDRSAAYALSAMVWKDPPGGATILPYILVHCALKFEWPPVASNGGKNISRDHYEVVTSFLVKSHDICKYSAQLLRPGEFLPASRLSSCGIDDDFGPARGPFCPSLGKYQHRLARAQDKMDNFGKARAILDRMQADLQNIVVRDDLVSFPVNGTVSDFAFYTLQKGISTGNNLRSLSYVNYLSGSGNVKNDRLLRSDEAYDYNTAPAFAIAPTPTPNPGPTVVPIAPTLTASELTLFQGQLGFAYGFLHSDGQYTNRYDVDSSNAPSKAVAVTVGILVMDNKNAAILKDRNLLDGLIADLAAPGAQGENWSPKAIWEHQLGSLAKAPNGAGTPIQIKKYGSTFLAGIRAFERTFRLPSQNE